MKKLILLAVLVLTLAQISCTSDINSNQKNDMSFKEVEKQFQLKNSFTETSKRAILKHYGSVKSYYEFAVNRKLDLKNKRNESLVSSENYATYRVGLWNKFERLHVYLQMRDDTYILDSAENAGIDLPYSCRCGADAAAVALQIYGTAADQAEQTFLDDEQIEAGYVLLDVAYPTSDSKFITHQEDELF